MLNRATPDFARELYIGEEPAVDALLRAAFGGSDAPAAMVRKLRKSSAIAGETVIPMGDRIIGYYALSHMIAPRNWLCLTPIAIAPDMQRSGHGKRMIGILTEWARLTGRAVVSRDDSGFLLKSGFVSDSDTPYCRSANAARADDLVFPAACAWSWP